MCFVMSVYVLCVECVVCVMSDSSCVVYGTLLRKRSPM